MGTKRLSARLEALEEATRAPADADFGQWEEVSEAEFCTIVARALHAHGRGEASSLFHNQGWPWGPPSRPGYIAGSDAYMENVACMVHAHLLVIEQSTGQRSLFVPLSRHEVRAALQAFTSGELYDQRDIDQQMRLYRRSGASEEVERLAGRVNKALWLSGDLGYTVTDIGEWLHSLAALYDELPAEDAREGTFAVVNDEERRPLTVANG